VQYFPAVAEPAETNLRILSAPAASFVLAILPFLAGCVSTNENYNREGDMVYSVTCRFQSVESCLEEAGKTCGTLGYKQVQKDGSPMPATAEQPQGIAALVAKTGYDRKIYVQCQHSYRPDP
jgi:hypothetical protein